MWQPANEMNAVNTADEDGLHVVYEKKGLLPFREAINEWYYQSCIPEAAFHKLYEILQTQALPHLPEDARAFMSHSENPPENFLSLEERQKIIKEKEAAIEQLKISIEMVKKGPQLRPAPRPSRPTVSNAALANLKKGSMRSVRMKPLSIKMDMVYGMLPVSALAKFRELCQHLEDPNVYEKFVHTLWSNCTGPRSQSIYVMCNFIFTQQLCKHFSWSGSVGKSRMDTTTVGKAIMQALSLIHEGHLVESDLRTIINWKTFSSKSLKMAPL